MLFCHVCGRVMNRNPSLGFVVFKCHCGVEKKGTPDDARISGSVLGASETTEMYDGLIRNAPYDRTNQLVWRDCDQCGLNYQVQVRVGIAEVIIYKCKCGKKSGGEHLAK